LATFKILRIKSIRNSC